MLVINEVLRIPESEFHWSFVRAGGPGGQNVNKVASKAVLRWDLIRSSSLPEDLRARLQAHERGRITIEGELVLTSQRFRQQERNRQDCRDKLRQLILRVLEPPKRRVTTRPTHSSRERRLLDKRRRARTKSTRARLTDE